MNNDKILDMLSYRRPAGSGGERAFIEKFLAPFNPVLKATNWVIEVPGGDGKTLFSCHTDTVHHNDKKQELVYDKGMNVVYKDDGEPLGGDNTAGVWILLEMIAAGVPGTYAFHYGEERGCLGSRDMARMFPLWLKQFDRAIAFDRRGTTSVITKQMGSTTCSDTFAIALSDMLKSGFEPDPTGFYTDTASYSGLIAECTNLSIGYALEHSKDEYLDLEHLALMRELAISLDWEELPTVRKAEGKSARDSRYSQPYGGAGYVRPPANTQCVPAKPAVFNDDDDEEGVNFLCEAGMAECETFKSALALCQTDAEYAATILYAFVTREKLDYDKYGAPKDFDEGTPEPSVAAMIADDPEVQEFVGEIMKREYPVEDPVERMH